MVQINNVNPKGLKQFKTDFCKVMRNVYGKDTEPCYLVGHEIGRAKNQTVVMQNRPDGTDGNVYAIGFPNPDRDSKFIEDVEYYAQMVLKDYPKFIYRGTRQVKDAAVVYFDLVEEKIEFTPLEAIAAEYKAAGRKQFIEDLIKTARKLGIEEQIAQAWVRE